MFNDLFRLAGERKPQLIRGTVLYLISSLFGSAPYVFIYLVLKSLFEDTLTIEQTIQWLIGIAGCLLLQGLFLQWSNFYTYLTSYRMIGDLRLRLGNHIRKLPMGFFTSKQAGDLNTLVSDDMNKIETVPAWVYPKLLNAIATPSFIALFLSVVDWRLSLAILASLPIALSIYASSRPRMQRLADSQKRATIEANSRIIEYIQGLAVLRSFNRAGASFQKLQQALANYRQANLDLVNQLVLPAVAFAAVLDLGFVVILAIGAYSLLGGELAIPNFMLFLILGLRFYAPLYVLFDFSAMIRMMEAALARVKETFNTSALPESFQSRALQNFEIEFRDVSFSYATNSVLRHISFSVPERSVTALVGPSGSGKTTIANLIARFWDVDQGEILIGGINLKQLPTDELLASISLVFQNVYLFNDTILNNIKFGNPDASLEQVIAAATAAQCHEFIANLPQGYETVIGEGGSTLSGGEKQRIAIARAILKDAPIVILDEATASVDPENEILIQQAINSLVASKTLIIIAHQLATITAADQILVIDQGEIVERGKHEALINANGLYQRLWESRQQARSWKINRQNLSSIAR